MQIPYVCKFCKAPGVLEVADEYLEEAKRFFPLACCNRCGDFMEKRSTLIRTLKPVCIRLGWMKQRSSTKEKEFEKERGLIVDLAKRINYLFCLYYRKTAVFDETFAQSLYEQPEKFFSICLHWQKYVAQNM